VTSKDRVVTQKKEKTRQTKMAKNRSQFFDQFLWRTIHAYNHKR